MYVYFKALDMFFQTVLQINVHLYMCVCACETESVFSL